MARMLIRFAILAVALAPLGARAVPLLQLDIAGGSYDAETETIVTSDDVFTVYAYATPQPHASSVLGRTLFLSIALTPETGPANVAAGSFTVNGVSYAATSDMTYGVPPIETNGTASHDGGDLGQHGIFETFFVEVPFVLTSASPTSGAYDTQDAAGQGPMAGLDMYYAAFQIDRRALPRDYQLHFDLYATQSGQALDRDIAFFAPFSHDAATAGRLVPVPEPTVAVLFGSALALLCGATHSRRAHPPCSLGYGRGEPRRGGEPGALGGAALPAGV